MRALVTGGAGFIGRAVVARLLDRGDHVTVLDDLSNGRRENLAEFAGNDRLRFVEGDIADPGAVAAVFDPAPETCFHLAASINVQDSIDDPRTTFRNDVIGTFEVLEAARAAGSRFLFMSTCMVYDRCRDAPIAETHPTRPASPYAASKIAGEALALSYHHAYGMPVAVLRPFNTYGPFQKSGGEGGVVAIFLENALAGRPLSIYGDGTQTRDFLYVEDCADFVLRAVASDAANGRILNAGTGSDVTINDLAVRIAPSADAIRHVEHIHPQSEIQRLCCDPALARDLLDWTPRVGLDEGLAQTRDWIGRTSREGT